MAGGEDVARARWVVAVACTQKREWKCGASLRARVWPSAAAVGWEAGLDMEMGSTRCRLAGLGLVGVRRLLLHAPLLAGLPASAAPFAASLRTHGRLEVNSRRTDRDRRTGLSIGMVRDICP